MGLIETDPHIALEIQHQYISAGVQESNNDAPGLECRTFKERKRFYQSVYSCYYGLHTTDAIITH